MSSLETGPGRYLLLFGSFLSPGDRGRGGGGRGREGGRTDCGTSVQLSSGRYCFFVFSFIFSLILNFCLLCIATDCVCVCVCVCV